MMVFLCESLHDEKNSYSKELQNFVMEEVGKTLRKSIESALDSSDIDYHRTENLDELDEFVVNFLGSEELIIQLTAHRDAIIADKTNIDKATASAEVLP